ncbi:dihydrofolate reductase [Enterococcus songbeiensis]|uniref:dihydrofolate reductase n=1 Tax=Enterococcus songbeiensis TaxID=2559927 RepID=UPI0010F55719|nr:dihydrofolate reductase [Enterococcus songbeiensis]
MLAAIWAEDKNGLIGHKGTLPWRLPNDLRFFKEKTTGHTIVMGRKTFEGMGSRPLPNRKTIVLTSNPTYQAAGVRVLHSADEVLALKEEQLFVIGGAVVFEALLPACDTLFRTVIDAEFEGDTYFPKLDWSKWEKVEVIEGILDEKNRYPHQFEIYKRK